ncbi:MAG: zinc metallopeptidase [Bernardetiaceae bacterium]|nr:zinc metallopeptidase [Bernardetiaceae bacterium]
MVVIMGASWIVQYMLKSRFKKFAETPLASNMSGAEVVQDMLAAHNINTVRITCIPGQLTDHYDPSNLSINLSEDVYHGRNAAAAAVAAHECGHAIQHAQDYSYLQLRSKLVPVVNFASQWITWVLIGGIFLLEFTPLPLIIGIVLFAMTTIFSFVTLPVEFDASNRALAWIKDSRVVNQQEYAMAKSALWWAAMTYVVAAIASLATLLYYVSILLGRRD